MASVIGLPDPTFPINQLGIGGFIGIGNRGIISKCYATGEVSAPDSFRVGGFVGSAAGGSIHDCYARGAVTGDDQVGGFIGRKRWATITNVYSTGLVTGNTNVGGLVGETIYGVVNTSFWDTETSEQATSDGGTGKTTAEMKTASTFTGWNF
ncbi:unnamed protein product, partial [marine sediment metagenome]